MASIFTKIIRGEIPAFKIYENDHVISFLDIRPVRIGHALVVPKVEVDYFIDVPEPFYSAVFQAAKIIAPAIQRATNAKRIVTTAIGLEVPHFHYHLIPVDKMGDFDFSKAKEAPMEALGEIQKKIIAALV
jgi:histidine triad (HIT) family protein